MRPHKQRLRFSSRSWRRQRTWGAQRTLAAGTGASREQGRKKTQAFELGFESTKGGGWRRHLEIDGGLRAVRRGLAGGFAFALWRAVSAVVQ
ncbi:hypothetical protein CBM2585_A40229 [Cupriavidus taiwanensis]|nr:hypothetical protein CBM2585_A40229 [Cupriavidus taiwanensis]